MVIAANTKRNGIKIIIERKCKIKSNICYLFDSISDFIQILITSIVKIHYILLTLTKKSKVKLENKKDNNTTKMNHKERLLKHVHGTSFLSYS